MNFLRTFFVYYDFSAILCYFSAEKLTEKPLRCDLFAVSAWVNFSKMFKVENLSPIFVRVILDQNIKFLQYIFTTSFVFTDKNKKEKY